MELLKMIIFKNDTHVDWKRTKENIREKIVEENPTLSNLKIESLVDETTIKAKKLIHRKGIKVAYYTQRMYMIWK